MLAATAFLASAVEFVEAATIVMAVGYTQGWRPALWGTAAAAAALAAIVAAFAPVLGSEAAVHVVQLVAGPFLVLFGIAWLRKAVWRYSGRKALRDETAAFARDVAELRGRTERNIGFATAFQGVFLEGLEVAVIVLGFAAARAALLPWAIGGAAVALVTVAIAAVAARGPLARVPENAMKAAVGTMLLTLGTFWTGEGLGVTWWSGDATLLQILAIYVAVAYVLTMSLRSRRAHA